MDKKHLSPSGEAGRYRRWFCLTLVLTLLLLALFALPTIYIDPFFHYHAPLEQYQYPLTNERYQNDGIVRHFSYDGIITGTSMTENFKTSEADALFDAHFVKVPFSGGRYKEINDNLSRAYQSSNTIRYIIRGLDLNTLILDKDSYRADYHFPYYLYNNNLFDDVQYVLNKSILFNYTLNVPQFTLTGHSTTNFDDYASWASSAEFQYGAKSVLSSLSFLGNVPQLSSLTQADHILIKENLQQNVIALASSHPETTFYLFFSPQSIANWGQLYKAGEIERQIDAQEMTIEMLLSVDNIRLYSFDNCFDLICNLENYKDVQHYGEWVNSWILEQLAKDNYRLTLDNYQEYLTTIRDFYTSYNYVALNDLK